MKVADNLFLAFTGLKLFLAS